MGTSGAAIMTKPIDRFVSENRRATRRIDSTFVEVASLRRRQFDFGISQFQISTSLEIYTRDLNNGLYSGHPDEEHGSGFGVAGDKRGDWELQSVVPVSKAFVRDGRNAIRDALSGDNTGAIGKTVVGDGDSTALTTNTSLDNETGRGFAWAMVGPDSNTTISRSHLLFSDFGEEVSEFGVESSGDDLYNRIVTSSVNLLQTEELRIDVTFEVDGSGRGNSEITNHGKDTVAESIRSTEDIVGIERFAFGTGDSEPSEDDESLEEEVFEKNVGYHIEPEIVTVYSIVVEAEPDAQPVTITEMGVKDNTGRLIWRTTIDGYEKNEDSEFEVYTGFRAK